MLRYLQPTLMPIYMIPQYQVSCGVNEMPPNHRYIVHITSGSWEPQCTRMLQRDNAIVIASGQGTFPLIYTY